MPTSSVSTLTFLFSLLYYQCSHWTCHHPLCYWSNSLFTTHFYCCLTFLLYFYLTYIKHQASFCSWQLVERAIIRRALEQQPFYGALLRTSDVSSFIWSLLSLSFQHHSVCQSCHRSNSLFKAYCYSHSFLFLVQLTTSVEHHSVWDLECPKWGCIDYTA